MKESYWGYWLVVLGIFVITVLLLIQNVTSQNTHDYYAVKEITQAAMIDAIDYEYMDTYGEVRINKEVFIESFLERFSQTASLNNTYKISFYDIYEVPPKVSLKVSSGSNSFKVFGDAEDFDIVNKIDAVLEVPTTYVPGKEAKAPCKLCITVEKGTKVIKRVIDGYKIPGATNEGFGVGGKYYDIVVEEDEDPKCKSIYAVFNNESDNGVKLDGLAYDIYTCRLYNKDGSPKKGCEVVLPIIAKGDVNVYGWKKKGESTIYTVGSTVTISSNTVFVPVFDTNPLKGVSKPVVVNPGTPVVDNKPKEEPKVDNTSCLKESITVDFDKLKDGDVTNATAWPQYASVQLYKKDKSKAKTVSAGTPMRVFSCDGSYCEVWVKGDNCTDHYLIKESQMLINLPDYIPSIVYGNKAVKASDSQKRRGIIYNRKIDGDAPIVPTRYSMAKRLLKVEQSIQAAGAKNNAKWTLYVDDLYRPVSAQGNPNYASNVNCLYEACGISYHAFAGAIDASIHYYDEETDSWKSIDMPAWKGKAQESATGAKKTNYNTLKNAMTNAGLKVYSPEWWHYNDPSAISDRSALSKSDAEKKKWATYKKMAWGSYAWVFDLSKINKAGAQYSYLDFLPKMYYED